jgi:hypothetical protein
MQATFTAALQSRFLERLTEQQLVEMIDVSRALGTPHC